MKRALPEFSWAAVLALSASTAAGCWPPALADPAPAPSDSTALEWPMGDRGARAELPSEVDAEEIDAALDFAFGDAGRDTLRTRALIVVYGGRIVAERYAAGLDSSSVPAGGSMGESVAAALAGVLVQQGRLRLDQAPIAVWSAPGGPRASLEVIRRTVAAAGEDPLAFPQRALFERIGIRTIVPGRDPRGNLAGFEGGCARDWARFGLLHLWNGMWQGERILPEGWIEFVRAPAPADSGRGHGARFGLNRGGAYRDIPEDAFWAAGDLGNVTMIIPSRDLVIVRIGQASDATSFGAYWNEVVSRIVSAIEVPVED